MTVSGHTPYASMTKAELVEEVVRLNRENAMLRKRLAIYKEMR
jgi:regulator of replication initiation timing